MRTKHAPAVWQTLKLEYANGNYTLKALAGKHGINLKTVESRAKREGWGGLRQVKLAELEQNTANALAEVGKLTAAQLQEKAEVFVSKVARLVDLWTDALAEIGEAKPRTLLELQAKADALKTIASIARPNFGLDAEHGPRSIVNVAVLSSDPISTT